MLWDNLKYLTTWGPSAFKLCTLPTGLVANSSSNEVFNQLLASEISTQDLASTMPHRSGFSKQGWGGCLLHEVLLLRLASLFHARHLWGLQCDRGSSRGRWLAKRGVEDLRSGTPALERNPGVSLLMPPPPPPSSSLPSPAPVNYLGLNWCKTGIASLSPTSSFLDLSSDPLRTSSFFLALGCLTTEGKGSETQIGHV